MRKPSEYIAAAKAHLRDSLIPDCSEVMRHGERSATVTRVGTTSIGEDAISGTEVPEGVRVLAWAADFPGLGRGRLVSLDGEWRVVTGARTDPAGATLSLSLSASLAATKAAYRRPGTKIAQTVDALAVEGEVVEPSGDALAPTPLCSWTVAVAEDGWPEPVAPQIGDMMELSPQDVVLKVAAVTRRDGFYVFQCRARR